MSLPSHFSFLVGYVHIALKLTRKSERTYHAAAETVIDLSSCI